jgi:hypothetical protein
MRLFLILLLVSFELSAQSAPKKIDFTQKMLDESVSEINKRMPVIVDRETIAESSSVGPGKQISLHYKLVNLGNKEALGLNLISLFSPELKNKACTSEMNVFLKNGVAVLYRYRSKEGLLVGDILVTPEDCNNSKLKNKK